MAIRVSMRVSMRVTMRVIVERGRRGCRDAFLNGHRRGALGSGDHGRRISQGLLFAGHLSLELGTLDVAKILTNEFIKGFGLGLYLERRALLTAAERAGSTPAILNVFKSRLGVMFRTWTDPTRRRERTTLAFILYFAWSEFKYSISHSNV